MLNQEKSGKKRGLNRELNPGPPAVICTYLYKGEMPEAGIILLDH